MSRKQLVTLFICSLIPWSLGNGLLPLLPAYATSLGAAPALVGYYLSIVYFALVSGTLLAGWLSDRLQHRKRLLILAGALMPLALWFMGRVTNAWQLTALTSAVWFLGGVQLSLLGILTGLFAGQAERGRVFGILALTAGLGALLGGLTIGNLVDRWGYASTLSLLATYSCILPVAALALSDKPAVRRAPVVGVRQAAPLSNGFYLLVSVGILVGTALSVGTLGNALAMKELGFLSANVSSTAAVGGLVTLPLAPLIGRLSDRLGRKGPIMLCYISGGLGLMMLSLATALWQFWLAAGLLAVAGISGVVSALVADLVPKEALGKGLSAQTASGWVGGIVGYALGGLAIEKLGTHSALLAVAPLFLAAIVLLVPICQYQVSGLLARSRWRQGCTEPPQDR